MPPANAAANAAAIAAMQQQLAALQAAQNANDSSSSSSSSEATDSEDDAILKVKLEPPKTKFSGRGSMLDGQTEWLSVKPVYEQWHAIRVNHSTEEQLAGLLMDSIEEPSRTLVYTTLQDKRLTYPRVIRVLEKKYQVDKVLARAEEQHKLRTLRRTGNQTLTEYLEVYDLCLKRNLNLGYAVRPEDGLDLIESADLNAEEHSRLFERLIEKGGDQEAPPVKLVRKLLERIAKGQQHRERVERQGRDGTRGREKNKDSKGSGGNRERAAFVAGVAAVVGKGKGKGKGKGGGKASVQRAIDKTYNKFAAGAKVRGALKSNFGGGGGGTGTRSWKGGGAVGGTGGVCKFHAQGKCLKGDACTFKHEDKNRPQQAAAFTFKTGDWTCPKCQAHNFASKQECFKSGCNEKRPAGVQPFVKRQ